MPYQRDQLLDAEVISCPGKVPSTKRLGLPDDFPAQCSGPMTWSAQEIAKQPESYVETLAIEDVEAIESAVMHFEGLGLARGFVNQATFPLPAQLGRRLRSVTCSIYDGPGFKIIRGLQPSKYTDSQLVIIYAGITSYVASNRHRSIDHVSDQAKNNPVDTNLLPPERSVPMDFHTDVDSLDILSMFIQSMPEHGGQQWIASINTIYNDLALSDPEVLQTLAQDWYWETTYRPCKDVVGTANYQRPLIAFEEGRLNVHFASAYVGASLQYPLSVKDTLSPEQKHALNALATAARNNSVQLSQHEGDIVILNNRTILHARAGFVDSDQKRRHLMRLWLQDDQRCWKTPKALGVSLEPFVEPAKQMLLTGAEWIKIPRGWRSALGTGISSPHD